MSVYYVYILYSESSDKYYAGSSDNPRTRLDSHNHSERDTFTTKHRPWKIKVIFEVGAERKDALIAERYIKQQKSRKFIEQLIEAEANVHP